MHYGLSTVAKTTLRRIDAVVQNLDHMVGAGASGVTPFALCLEMVDQVIDFSNFEQKVLDPSCGKGSFLLAVIKRFIEAGCPVDRAVLNVYGIDNCESQCDHARVNIQRATGYMLLIECQDSLSKDFRMKFDAVVGNPPYQSSSDSKGNKLWPKFILAAHQLVKDNGHLAMVTPTGWAAGGVNIPGGKGVVSDVFSKSQVLQINADKINEKYFPKIGIEISYFTLQKTEVTKPTKIILHDGVVDVDFRTTDIVSPRLNSVDISISKKVFAEKHKKFEVESFDRKIKQGTIVESKTPEGVYCNKHWILGGTTAGNATFTYLDYEHTPQLKYPKVVFNIGNRYWQPYYDLDGINIAAQGYAIRLLGNETIESLTSVFEHPLYVYLSFHYQLQLKGFMKTNIVRSYPSLDLSKIWKKEELYDQFGITTDERVHIESILQGTKHS